MHRFFLLLLFALTPIACSTENPLCTDNFCVEGEIFEKADLATDAPFDELPATVDEERVIELLTVTPQDSDAFEPVNITRDTEPPTVTGGSIKNGDRDVDPEVINSAAKIEVTFSEMVRGHIALQTFPGGDDVGWLGNVNGNKGVLELLGGKEIGTGTLYVIVCVVTDAAGNRTEIKTLFHTKGVKRSVVEEDTVVPEEPKVSFKDDILPIFKNHCQVCHRRSNLHFPKAGLDLSSHKGTMKVVDPGWSKQSPIYWRIRADQVPFTRMPLAKPPLSAEQIQLIIDWIDEGAKNN